MSNISGISEAIFPRYIRKNPRRMYTRVPHMIAQFVLKIESKAPSSYLMESFGTKKCSIRKVF